MHADLHFADLEPLLAHLNQEQRPTLTGTAQLDVKAMGTLRRPLLDASLKGSGLTAALGQWPAATNIDIDGALRSGDVELTSLTATWQDATLHLQGSGPFRMIEPWLPAAWGAIQSRPGPARITAEIRDITPAALAPFVKPETLANIDGHLSGRVVVQADCLAAEAWQGDIVLDEADVSLSQVSIRQDDTTRLTLKDGNLRVDTWRWTGPGTTIVAAGGVSFGTRQPRLDAAVDANVDLRTASAFLRPAATGGHADVSVSLAGPLTEPIIEGRVLLLDAEFRMRDPRISRSRDVRGTLWLASGRVWLEQIRGTLNGGPVSIDGTATPRISRGHCSCGHCRPRRGHRIPERASHGSRA